jgi:hypothetical protein
VTPPDSTPPRFEEHLEQAFRRLKLALRGLLEEVDASPSSPLQISERLGVPRTLSWRAGKIARSESAAECVQHVPGRTARQSLLAAFEGASCSPDALEEARVAFESFDEMVRTHGGDRATLDLLVGGLSAETPKADLLEQHRKLAFQGNSATLGVQARLQFSTAVVRPNADDPGRVDLVRLGGLLGLKRLRPSIRWPIARLQTWTVEEDGAISLGGSPLTPGRSPLISGFCLPHEQEIELREHGELTRLELPPGSIGNAAAVDCVFGRGLTGIGSARRRGSEDRVFLGNHGFTPVEVAQHDVLVHRDLAWGPPTYHLLSTLGDDLGIDMEAELDRAVPLAEEVRELGAGIEPMESPRYTRYRELLEWTMERLGASPDEFVGYRLSLPHPPIPSASLFRFLLPD